MSKRTFCPYCGTTNLVKGQLKYIDTFGTEIYKCQMCNHEFTDLSTQYAELIIKSKNEKNG